ncbi:MAG: CbiX/SirB N-terminal domain-containing protein [Burkholderiaceae bacterium]|nr:CbiX/SirB N-terminal domain-containing protein [Burkholderiaceae bacterium]
MDGILLFAHGARDPAWAQPFQKVETGLRAARPGLAVRLAYLEFMSPSVAEAAGQLVEAGCRQIQVVPLFLGTGGHVRRDLPMLLEQLRVQHGPRVSWHLQPPIGEAAAVIDAMIEVCIAAVSNTGSLETP